MSHITSHSFPIVVNRHTFSEEDTTRLEVMLQAIPAIRHKEIVRRTITKFHIVDLEDGVTKKVTVQSYVKEKEVHGKYCVTVDNSFGVARRVAYFEGLFLA
eukprot:Awhi_evm2s2788